MWIKIFFIIVNTSYCDLNVCNPTECCGFREKWRFLRIFAQKINLTYSINMNIIDMMFLLCAKFIRKMFLVVKQKTSGSIQELLLVTEINHLI